MAAILEGVSFPGLGAGTIAARHRAVLFAAAYLACLVLPWYFHLRVREEVVFTHVFYVPIVLAGAWWGLRALTAAGVLVVNLLLAHALGSTEIPFGADVLRGAMLMVVGGVLGLAVEKRNRLEAEANLEHRRNEEQMRAHLEYVERVSHELRNPLQVSLGVLDTLEPVNLPVEQRELLVLLNRSTDRIRERIKDLTSDERN